MLINGPKCVSASRNEGALAPLAPIGVLLLGTPRPGLALPAALQVRDAEPGCEAILALDAEGLAAAEGLLRRPRFWVTPLADVSGAGAWFADHCETLPSPEALARVADALATIVGALRTLPPPAATGDGNAEAALLARIHSRGGTMTPVYDAGARDWVRHPAAGLIPESAETAERLTTRGHLSRRFFDRLHVCPGCGGARLATREECSRCRSTDIVDESLLHHFRCGTQALEREFRRDDALVCPKCSARLRHYSVDYDRPGSAVSCRACGHVDAAPAVGFRCIDCGRHADAGVVATRDWYAYSLTATGVQRLQSGGADPAAAYIAPVDGDRAMARHWLRIQARYGRPGTVLRLTFSGGNALRAAQGSRVLEQLRRQALEIARGELRQTDFLVETEAGALLVLPETEAEMADIPRGRLVQQLRALLPAELGISIARIDVSEALAETQSR